MGILLRGNKLPAQNLKKYANKSIYDKMAEW